MDSSPKHENALIIYSPRCPMEGWVKGLSPQNTWGVLGVNSVSAKATSSSDVIKQHKTSLKSTIGSGEASGRSRMNTPLARVCVGFQCDCAYVDVPPFITFEESVPGYFNCMDSAATLFTPETPEVVCGLQLFTHPSIGIVMSWWVHFHFFRELSL